MEVTGRVTKVTGLVIEVAGLRLPIGGRCIIPLPNGVAVNAEVVGFDHDRLLLMPQSSIEGISPSAKVFAAPTQLGGAHAEALSGRLPVGYGLLGRVVDANGAALDRFGPVLAQEYVSLTAVPPNPLNRARIDTVLDVGVRAINALLTIGRGQRVGLFAGTGVGKSMLLGMMARYTEADVVVVGLIGERGREVKEFIEDILGPETLAKAVVVAAPADSPALMRLQAAQYACAIAEFFRDRGQHVLLIMDSLTRYAMAQREIALAVGEPPATKGYPPSVFAKLPVLVERAGNGEDDSGSITAFYTVLTEGDDQQDPIADAARGVLDGHIVLSRSLAESGHYPAIDVEQSISRVMSAVVPLAHQKLARKLKQLSSRYNRSVELINVGAYVSGSDPVLDEAIAKKAAITAFLQQMPDEAANALTSVTSLAELFGNNYQDLLRAEQAVTHG
jgi:flagellum-specific ATP synthase